MADAVAPQTPPKKLFKPSTKTKTPTRSKPTTTQQAETPPRAADNAPRSVTSESTLAPDGSFLDDITNSTKLAPLTDVSAPSDELTDNGLVENYVLSPTDTASRGTGARASHSGDTSQNEKESSPSFKDKVSRTRESAEGPAGGLAQGLVGKVTEAAKGVAGNLSGGADSPIEEIESPTNMAKYFKDQGLPEMSNFINSLTGNQSNGSGEDTPRAAKSPARETQSTSDRTGKATSDQKDERSHRASPQGEPRHKSNPKMSDPSSVSKAADGAFRDTRDREPTATPTNKMGEPNVANISQSAHPAVPAAKSDTGKQSHGSSQPGDEDGNTRVFDNMGRPQRVERSIEIPLQRQGSSSNNPSESEKQRTGSQDLGDFEDLPDTAHQPSFSSDLPDISEEDSDPPEEILDPSVHGESSSSITPIPKIPKIPHIDSTPPADLFRLAQGLAGYVVDDVGNIVDEAGEVLGHATGDLPEMVGKKVSDDGEVYGDGGEIVGYVSENFVNPPSPTEIPSDVLGRLRVDHEGNILDSDGKVIGRFHDPPARKSSTPKPSAKSPSPDARPDAKTKEEQKPKVNAQTGGSPSDLFLDVKSTTDGIQLTIRIPTTFSRQPSES
ncbi:hypothetical protein F4802DRAFT_564686 [Xylaria palmicola]|nr:hypothetical protein F4802DRAFT_564686 [Xylaria palmicola]